MFEDNHIEEFDLMMKSILDEGREEVPASVWDGISEGLDKAARRRTVVLWWRRSAIGASVAAAVAAGVFFGHSESEDIVPLTANDGLIAVVEPVAPVSDVVIAEVIQEEPVNPHKVRSIIPQTAAEAVEIADEQHFEAVEETTEEKADVKPEPVVEETGQAEVKAVETTEEPVYFPEDWGEDEKPSKKDVSLVLSGIAGTNSAHNSNAPDPMRAPGTTAPQRTGITETSNKSTYGIPLSAGAGVKIGLSPKWSLGVGANYTFMSRRFYGKYTQVNADGSIANTTSSDIQNTQHYVGIPVNAFYDVISNDHISFYAYAGGAVEKCISDRYNVLNTSIVHKEKVKGVQVSANVGIGVEFMLGRHLGIYIDPSLRYYFDCGQPKSIRTAQPLMLGFEMGLRARL